MKNAIAEIKTSLDGLKRRIEVTEEKENECKYRFMEIILPENDKEKIFLNEQIIRYMQDNIKMFSICIIRVKEETEGENGAEQICKEIMAESFPNLM